MAARADHVLPAATDWQDAYLEGLAAGAADKLAQIGPWLDRLALRPGDRLVDMGCGPGALAAALAARHPGLRIVARDADPAMVEAARRRLRGRPGVDVDVDIGDARTCRCGPARAWILVSTLHELQAEGGRAAVARALALAASQLAPGGLLIVRDFVRPDDADRRVVLCHDRRDVAPGRGFADFARAAPFEVRLDPEARHVEGPPGHEIHHTDVASVYDYLFRKDAGPAWAHELPQRYGFWTLAEALDLVRRAGLTTLQARRVRHDWVAAHRVDGRVVVLDARTRRPIEAPLTQLLLVARAG